MNYQALSFTYISPLDLEIINDVLAAELGEIGFESFVTHENGLTAYISENNYDPAILDERLTVFPLEGVEIRYESELIVGQDWNEEWEKNYFKPIRIGKDCIIRASFHPEEEGFTYPILIDPKMAFGTGNHETTFLMISEILKIDMEGKEVLDMGCGTAVLAILSAMKGAKRIVAIDIDEWAYANAIENCKLNQTEQIRVVLGGAEKIADYPPFDLIFANINRNILLADMAEYVRNLKPGGYLYMSGFYEEDIPVIEKEMTAQGLTLASVAGKNNWVALKTKR
ncbi:50S ribosomal protein L11 methyltransferase [Parabacteroides sp. PF5-6]|uniref:50S ribosomal protein L11 methyltransferase n=1 Tax=Parabacteroides sp. PF5-6 TaxID=1742403 RepID=UPI0024054989|nr:50S ribosomal protein L11 methyltransferase [Parabacteroides sp. PF5-6]MDF9828860.1 ribosomal protein L11 methyltransferase [Parabacteroides sp. PF5-6]